MGKLFKTVILFSFLSLIFLTGCDDSKGEDTHYKPSEYKHNIAVNNADSAVDDVNKEILQMGAETSADIVYNTYNDGITKLNEQLTILENTKKQISDDTDLTNSEIKSWNSRYDDSIKSVKNAIKKIEKQKADFLK